MCGGFGVIVEVLEGAGLEEFCGVEEESEGECGVLCCGGSVGVLGGGGWVGVSG